MQNSSLSIGLDSHIRVWDYNFKLIKQKLILDPYPLVIVGFDNKFLVGLGSGKIMQLNTNLDV
jgi:hypothetical protein